MRIVIDMQGAQSSGSWNRGIGRYSLSLALAIVRNRGEHEIFLALNSAFPESVERIRSIFLEHLPQNNIRTWSSPGSCAFNEVSSDWRRQASERLREAFLESLNPDVVLVSSLFEGLIDDAVTSVNSLSSNVLTAVILYDLIPFIHRSPYLDNPQVEKWYLNKIDFLKRSNLFLSISESSRIEGVDYLGLPQDCAINISTDADEPFRKISISENGRKRLFEKYGINHKFVMYTGGIDHRKNIDGLIRAYAKLEPELRTEYQLVIVCAAKEDARLALQRLAEDHGLKNTEVKFTGFVSEEDLIQLYNQCSLFVFPSWHEGFGLPVLEAMRCGAPVIGGNTSSLPEVIGFEDALFDPHSDNDIARVLKRALVDVEFGEKLLMHCELQASKFSWDETSLKAIHVMEAAVESWNTKSSNVHEISNVRKPRLAYLSPLPPERSGISDYSAELLPALAKFYDVEVIVAQDEISAPWITANCPVRSVSWFVENSSQFDRVLYHFGNSAFHKHMFGLLPKIPGVVVLHDFFLSGIVYHLDVTGQIQDFFQKNIYESHGYSGLFDLHNTADKEEIIWKYPANRAVIENSLGLITHSENTLQLAKRWYDDSDSSWVTIPLLRIAAEQGLRERSRQKLDFTHQDFVVCSFGMIGPTKLSHRLLEAWLKSALATHESCHLIFVGENHPGEYGKDLQNKLKENLNCSRVKITGWIDQKTFRDYLFSADVGIQLRTLSRGETSAAVLDCMNHGLATIVNANGSMADLHEDAVWMMSDEFRDEDLVYALEELWSKTATREQLGTKASQIIREQHDPQVCAQQYYETIEKIYKEKSPELSSLIESVADIPGENPSDSELIPFADAITTSLPAKNAMKQLLVDVSELVNDDAKTGIQRTVRSTLRHWLENPPLGWRVEPVYASMEHTYRYARKFTCNFLGIEQNCFHDDPISFSPGDVFFGLDIQPNVQVAQSGFYQRLRTHGVTVKFMIYDMLPTSHREFFASVDADAFQQWLEVVGECDGAVCISNAVADELSVWLEERTWNRKLPFSIEWNHLGADIDSSIPTSGLPVDAEGTLSKLKNLSTFLMVGTLEPRKGHAQVIEAFEQLWLEGAEVTLVIVGKQGWLVDELVNRIKTHPERNKRLFWLQGISDEYLEKLYAASSCLIAASYGEGFGLPLTEAAQHKLPIMARDIPVFREVALEHAYFFNTSTAKELAESLQAWLKLYKAGTYPRSDNMPWLTWHESAARLMEIVLGRSHEEMPKCYQSETSESSIHTTDLR